MSDQQEPIHIVRDLNSLPLPPESLWVRATRPPAPTTVLAFAALAVAALILVALPLATRVADEQAQSQAAASTKPTPTASPSHHPGAAVIPQCPAGQTPTLDVASAPPPGDAPGTGSPNAEAAFRRLRPAVTNFTVNYPFGPSVGAPVWIVAGDDTFVAEVHGTPDGNNWFAYPAKFVGCRTP